MAVNYQKLVNPKPRSYQYGDHTEFSPPRCDQRIRFSWGKFNMAAVSQERCEEKPENSTHDVSNSGFILVRSRESRVRR